MLKALINDLRYAQTTGVRVEMYLLNGEKLLKGVHDVDEDEGFVSMYAPQNLGDDTTTRKIPLDVIASVTVTDDRWKD